MNFVAQSEIVMEVIVARTLGFCFGVRDAIELAHREAAAGELTVLGELVHNPAVIRGLSAAGVRQAGPHEAPAPGARLMITAHGASDLRRNQLRDAGYQVLDATCPLVRHAHSSLARLVRDGYFPVVLGRRGHAEVRGLVEDLPECAVVETEADLDQLEGRSRLGVISQTTNNLQRVDELVAAIRARFTSAEVRFINTVCAPTRARQEATADLARQCELVIVIGGRTSNNSRELVETCRSEGARAYLVEGPEEIDPAWLRGAGRVGIAAGASTPDDVIEAVRLRLVELAQEIDPARRD